MVLCESMIEIIFLYMSNHRFPFEMTVFGGTSPFSDTPIGRRSPTFMSMVLYPLNASPKCLAGPVLSVLRAVGQMRNIQEGRLRVLLKGSSITLGNSTVRNLDALIRFEELPTKNAGFLQTVKLPEGIQIDEFATMYL